MFKLASATVAALALTIVAAAPSTASADWPPSFDDHHEVHVDYALHGWRSKHTHDHHGAHELADFLRSVGASVQIDHNGGHYDVIYTCPHPRMRYFDCDHEAHDFARSLRRLGFSARVHH